jgi:hypothetical protein
LLIIEEVPYIKGGIHLYMERVYTVYIYTPWVYILTSGDGRTVPTAKLQSNEISLHFSKFTFIHAL